MDLEQKIIFGIVGYLLLVLVAAIAIPLSFAVTLNLMILGVLLIGTPYGAYRFFKFKKIHSYERDFPKFLRDLAESRRAGLSIAESIKNSAKSEYGSLTPIIRKLNNQLSWNIPIEHVFDKFSEQMKDSSVITNSILIIQQANKAGGAIEKTMESLADNIEALRDVEQEKSSLLSQQVLMTYAIFFVFLGITIALIKFLVPVLQTQSHFGGFALETLSGNPCEPCLSSTDLLCTSCTVLFGVSDGFGFGGHTDPVAYYKALFFVMIMVQAIFTGLIAGQIGSDSVAAGLKHSAIMFVVGFVIFLAVIKLGIV